MCFNFPKVKKKKEKTISTSPFKKLPELISGDALLKKNSSSIPLAHPEAIHPGIKVKHPQFGIGVVEETEGERTEPELFKISVRFDDEPKRARRMVFKYARLSVVEG